MQRWESASRARRLNCCSLHLLATLPFRSAACDRLQELAHEVAVLDVTTELSRGEQVASQGSDENSTAEVDIGEDNYQRLIEEDQSVEGVSCRKWCHVCNKPVYG